MKILRLNKDTERLLADELKKRSPGRMKKYEEAVDEIISNVRENGDKAVFEYTKRFDGFDVNEKNIIVSDDEISKAYDEVDTMEELLVL